MPAGPTRRAADAAHCRRQRTAYLLLACVLAACGAAPDRPAANKPAPAVATRKPIVATATRRSTRMPSHTPTATPTATPTVTPRSTNTSTPVALLPFTDDFKNARTGLPEETYQNLKSYYSSSGFKIDFLAANLLQMEPYPREFPADFSAQLRLKLGTNLSTSAGLAFRVADQDNYYAFIVNGGGDFWLLKVADGKTETLQSAEIEQLQNAFEIGDLRIDVQGSEFRVYAHDILLTVAQDETFAAGGIGLVGWSEDGADSLSFTQLDVIEYGQRSVPAGSECALTVDDSPHAGTRQVRLGPLGADGMARLRIEAGDEAILLFARTANPLEVIYVSAATDPSGKDLYNPDYDGTQNSTAQLVWPAAPSNEGELTLFLPLTPVEMLLPGNYEFNLSTQEGAPICDALAIVRTATDPVPLVLDVNLWLVSDAPQLAAAAGRQLLEDTLRQSARRILEPHNLSIGTVHFGEASAAQRARLQRIPDTQYEELCSALKADMGSGYRMNVAVVDEYRVAFPEGAAEEPVLGLAPQPGAAIITEGRNSCAVVAWELMEGDTQELAATIIHESAHFLGLAHTTDEDGRSFDFLSDTPQCSAATADADGDKTVDVRECALFDANNLMFWQSGVEQAAVNLTAQQTWLLRRHPLFHPAPQTP